MSESATPDATRRRRRGSSSSPAELASPLEDEDLLQEILLCLPPQPSSLLRASAVCKLWRGLIIDPKFLRRFRDRHREPPLLGFFENFGGRVKFRSILNPPDRIPPKRFDLGSTARRREDVLDCRHGRVLLLDRLGVEVVVCDPITDEQRSLSIPAELMILGRELYISISGAVLCAAGDQGHVHGSCHSSPFKVVLVSRRTSENRPLARVYSSETGIWGSIISTAASCQFFGTGSPGTLVGNALYWLSLTGHILEFDLDRQSLVLIEEPPGLNEPLGHRQIVKADDGDVGLAVISKSCSKSYFEMWQRKVNFQGVTTWFLRKIVDMHIVLGFSPQIKRNRGPMLGYDEDTDMIRNRGRMLWYDEDTDMIFLYMHGAVHMVHLKSMQYKKKLYETDLLTTANYYPFKSFFAPGIAIAAEYDGTEVLHGGLIR